MGVRRARRQPRARGLQPGPADAAAREADRSRPPRRPRGARRARGTRRSPTSPARWTWWASTGAPSTRGRRWTRRSRPAKAVWLPLDVVDGGGAAREGRRARRRHGPLPRRRMGPARLSAQSSRGAARPSPSPGRRGPAGTPSSWPAVPRRTRPGCGRPAARRCGRRPPRPSRPGRRGHLHDRQQRVHAVQVLQRDGDADHRQRRHRREHARQVRGPATPAMITRRPRAAASSP